MSQIPGHAGERYPNPQPPPLASPR
jgi:hypothetical protein